MQSTCIDRRFWCNFLNNLKEFSLDGKTSSSNLWFSQLHIPVAISQQPNYVEIVAVFLQSKSRQNKRQVVDTTNTVCYNITEQIRFSTQLLLMTLIKIVKEELVQHKLLHIFWNLYKTSLRRNINCDMNILFFGAE